MRRNKTPRPPVLLKTILDVLFWILLIRLILSFGLLIVAVLTDTPIIFPSEDFVSTERPVETIVIGLAERMLSGIFVYVVYILRKIVRSFFKRKLFTSLQISGLKLAGQLIILVSLGEAALNFIFKLVMGNRVSTGIQMEESFGSFWFSLALGMFFILMAKSFHYAKSLKEEQDLTI